jgi:hypothetical protein
MVDANLIKSKKNAKLNKNAILECYEKNLFDDKAGFRALDGNPGYGQELV